MTRNTKHPRATRFAPHPTPGRLALIFNLALGLLLLISSSAQAQATSLLDELDIQKDSIRRIEPGESQPTWEVTHPAVWNVVDEVKDGLKAELIPPVLFDGHLYYGLFNWLIQLDPTTGVIQSRERFPAPIAHLEPKDDTILVRMEHWSNSSKDPHQVDFQHRPGAQRSQEIWHLGLIMPLFQDAAHLTPGINHCRYHPTPEQRAEDLIRLEKQAAQDPNNPYYDFYRAMLLAQSEQPEEARAAFEAAADTQERDWTILLSLTAFLDREGQHDLADQTFVRAQEIIDADEHISLHRWTTLVGQMPLLGWSKDKINETLQAGDFELVDHLLDRQAWAFPQMEYAPPVYTLFADAADTAGYPQLAEKWHSRAEEPRPLAFDALSQKLALYTELGLFLFGVFITGSLLGAFAIGLRRPRKPGEPVIAWRATPAESAGLLIAMVMVFVSFNLYQVSAASIQHLTAAPSEAFTNAWTSPNTSRWIEELHPSDARDTLLAQIRPFAEATRRGELAQFDGELPDSELFTAAVHADNQRRIWLGSLTGAPQPERSLMDSIINGTTQLISVVIVVLLSYLFGTFLGRKFPRLEAALRLLIPGGARSASFATPLLAGAVIAALSALLSGSGSIIQRIATPGYASYFGLESLGSLQPSDPLTALYWTLFILAAGAHIATSLYDRRTSAE